MNRSGKMRTWWFWDLVMELFNGKQQSVHPSSVLCSVTSVRELATTICDVLASVLASSYKTWLPHCALCTITASSCLPVSSSSSHPTIINSYFYIFVWITVSARNLKKWDYDVLISEHSGCWWEYFWILDREKLAGLPPKYLCLAKLISPAPDFYPFISLWERNWMSGILKLLNCSFKGQVCKI